MAMMIVTLKIMPEDPEVDLESLIPKIKEKIKIYGAELRDEYSLEPLAFGLKALKIKFLVDESRGSDEIAEAVKDIEGISNADVIDMSRTMG